VRAINYFVTYNFVLDCTLSKLVNNGANINSIYIPSHHKIFYLSLLIFYNILYIRFLIRTANETHIHKCINPMKPKLV
jgi:hypothetical protein